MFHECIDGWCLQRGGAMLVYCVICLCETLDLPEPLDHQRGDPPVAPIPHSTGPETKGRRMHPWSPTPAGCVVSP